MLDARQEYRIDVLQDACVLLQSEVGRLGEKLLQQAVLLADLQGLSLTQEELLALEPVPLGVAGDWIDEASQPKSGGAEKRLSRGHGPCAQPRLEIDEVVHELTAEDRECEICGGHLEEMGTVSQDSEEITVVERTYRLQLHRRRKYRCRCNARVKTAPGPVKFIPGGRYSADFALRVALDKYLDHLPLERQVERMGRAGLEVTSQTLWDQIDALAGFLEPTYDAIFRQVLGEPVVHADETGWMLAEGGKHEGRKRHRKKTTRATAWVLSSPRYCYFALLGSKSHAAGLSLLATYSGALVADGYQVYETLARGDPSSEDPRFQLVNCWAHVLRRFREIEANDPRCSQILSWIGKLAEIDAEVEGPFPGDDSAAAQRLELRQQKSRPILEQMRSWSFQQGGLRRSDFGRALRYMMKRWPALTAYLEDGRIPMTNNLAERELRQLVLGRKNHFGSRSKRGAKVAAILYSLVETAKLSGLDPATYIMAAATAAVQRPGAATLPASLLDSK